MPTSSQPLPGEHLDIEKMPGHWLLARMGKRVLRPGGVELTRWMLKALGIGEADQVVELAPGLGATARLAVGYKPAGYVGIDRDKAAADTVARKLNHPRYRCLTGTASDTGLVSDSATVVYGEAMLTMQTPAQKAAIVREAFRVLKPGGHYGIHELGLTPDSLSETAKGEVHRSISQAIRVGARPLTSSEWRAVLQDQGFEIESQNSAPMHLLEPARVIRDEGLAGTLKIAANVLRNPAARRRILNMRRAFRNHQGMLCAISIVARKPEQ